jgi:hypothetical protein
MYIPTFVGLVPKPVTGCSDAAATAGNIRAKELSKAWRDLLRDNTLNRELMCLKNIKEDRD